MHESDVDGALDRAPVLAEQAVRRVRLGEAQAVHDDARLPAVPSTGTASAWPPKTLTEFGKVNLLRDPRQCIVIASDDEDADAGLVQPTKLLGEIPRCLHRRLIAVVEVACEEERIDFFVEAKIDGAREGLPRRGADQIREAWSRNASERRGESRWMSAAWTKRKAIDVPTLPSGSDRVLAVHGNQQIAELVLRDAVVRARRRSCNRAARGWQAR